MFLKNFQFLPFVLTFLHSRTLFPLHFPPTLPTYSLFSSPSSQGTRDYDPFQMSKVIYDLADQGGELQSLCYDLTVSTHVHVHNTKMYTVHVP